MPDSGAAHRAMKEALANLDKRLDDKVDSLDEKIEKKFLELSGKIQELITKLDKHSAEKLVIEPSVQVSDAKFDELQESILKIRDLVNKKLIANKKKLNYRINFLERRIVDIERDATLNNQNSRKNNFEMNGIPASISHDDLEGKVIDILNTNPIYNFKLEDMEACHRISSKNSTTIIRMKNRRHTESILRHSKDFQGIQTEPLGLGKSKIFINNNLTPKLKTSYNCRILKRNISIADTWSGNGILKIKLLNVEIKKISHERDLYREFPNFSGFTFDVEFLHNAEEYEEYADYDIESLHSDHSWTW